MNKYTQRIIYILGNGFDLAANLPTRYTDFMGLLENWTAFYKEYALYATTKAPSEHLECPPNGKLTKEILLEYAKYRSIFNEENIEKIDDIIKKNIWVKYFLNCGYKKPSWAGFENEIKDTLLCTDRLLRSNVNFRKEGMTAREKAVHEMFITVCPSMKNYGHMVQNEESVMNFRKYYIDKTAKQLLEFTEAFRLYLLEFVERMRINKNPGLAMNETTQVCVISLNYTHGQLNATGVQSENLHMLHGSDEIPNNLVMGIENDDKLSNEFIRFKKYFQRIQKKTGSNYKAFLKGGSNQFGNPLPHKIIFYGHSLDPIDTDFIKDIFENAQGTIYIHYRDQEDYEQKVINCVNIFGSDYVINAVEKKSIVFIDSDLATISGQ